MEAFKEYIEKLNKLELEKIYENDFFLAWEKTRDELEAIFTVTDTLRYLRENNISAGIFDSDLKTSLFCNNSTRTRSSLTSARSLLGLEVQDSDEGKNQVSHGETVRETANMISFMVGIIGIHDDIYIGKDNAYIHEVSESVQGGYKDGALEQHPTLVNLQYDIDHPTRAMADALHLIHESGGIEDLKGEKVAMTWVYSPSYGKPLSIPQGIIGLVTRLGMGVVLTHPEGYEIIPEVGEVTKKNTAEFGGNFIRTNSTTEAFKDANVVYPKSWAPFAAMEKRTRLYGNGDQTGTDQLKQKLLSQNKKYKDWGCTGESMKAMKGGKVLYMYYLSTDITGVSREEGEVEASVFDHHRVELYKEASYKPCVITATIFLSRVKNPQKTLTDLADKVTPREAK